MKEMKEEGCRDLETRRMKKDMDLQTFLSQVIGGGSR